MNGEVGKHKVGNLRGPLDISGEAWREHEWLETGHTYRIDAPKTLWIGHHCVRILDLAGIVHLLPNPETKPVVVRWKPRNEQEPVQF